MNNIFTVIEKLKEELESNVLINSVSQGDIFDVDLLKHSIYPLAHIGLTNATISSESGVSYVTMSLLLLDIVDESKDEGDFYGSDNENYVQNSMFAVATNTIQVLMRGDLYSDGFQIEEDANIEFLAEKFEAKLAGVGVDFTVTIRNTVDLC